MKIRPLRDRVVAKRLKPAEQLQGGLIIPDSAKEKSQEAEIVAVGPGRLAEDGQYIPLDVQVGDHVIISQYSGSEIPGADGDLLILREKDIMAVEVRAAGPHGTGDAPAVEIRAAGPHGTGGGIDE